MRILNLHQFKKEPVGTVYSTYIPEGHLEHPVSIKTSTTNNTTKLDSILTLLPTELFTYAKSVNDEYSDGDRMKWSPINIQAEDYNEDTLFAVFDNDEIAKMIQILLYGLSKGQTSISFGDEYEVYRDYKHPTEYKIDSRQCGRVDK